MELNKNYLSKGSKTLIVKSLETNEVKVIDLKEEIHYDKTPEKQNAERK